MKSLECEKCGDEMNELSIKILGPEFKYHSCKKCGRIQYEEYSIIGLAEMIVDKIDQCSMKDLNTFTEFRKMLRSKSNIRKITKVRNVAKITEATKVITYPQIASYSALDFFNKSSNSVQPESIAAGLDLISSMFCAQIKSG